VTRGATFTPFSPRDGVANEAFIYMSRMGAPTVVSGAVSDTGKQNA